MGIQWRAILLAGVALATTAAPAVAQDRGRDPEAANGGDEGNEIIVTARRRDEVLQDVPQTINAVSSDTIQKLRINNASDIAQVVPGLSIDGGTSASGGFGSSTGIRGVPTFLNSNASPIVQFYLNDATTGNGPEVTQSLFDIGQIEVLKGPQGTLRGRSAPSGAITITTRRPDLDRIGGSVVMSGTEKGNINLQAAVGVPIIPGVLAVRLAGLVDHNDGNGVTSVNAPRDPYTRSEAVRGTLLFQPSPDFTASIMYQRLWRDARSFTQVVGPGNGLAPAVRNGPAIAAGDRLGITDGASETTSKTDFLVGSFDWGFAGQKLSYVGSYRKARSHGHSPQDQANVLPGVEYYQFTDTPGNAFSHELRLSSEERIAGIFDYTVGVFYNKEKAHPTVDGVAAFLTGAFGRPGAPVVQDPLPRYTLRTAIAIDPVSSEKSAFGNVTAHLGEKTELSVGGRFIQFKRHDRFSLALRGGFNAIANPTGGFLSCERAAALSPQLAGLVTSPVYSGLCDLPIASATLQNVDRRDKFTPFIYNIALSHKFTPDFMIFGNLGTAFRSAGPAIGLTSPITCCTAAGGPALQGIEDLVFHGQERSKTYEIGFKSSFFDRRARLNVSLFKQTFDNFFFLTQATRYLSVSNPANPLARNAQGVITGSTVSSSEFTADADAKVKGIDIEASFQVTPRWSVNLGYTWSKAHLSNASIPCNDSNFDGTPDGGVPDQTAFVNAGVLVARCRSSASISRTPRWNLTAQSEYSMPVSDKVDAFVRGNFIYYPKNPNASVRPDPVISKYSLLNMYAGIRDPDNGWEVSLFANNLLDTQQVVSINPVAQTSSGGVGATFGRNISGYKAIGYTPRREFGLLVRYAFGAR